jgi:hypothetical protein
VPLPETAPESVMAWLVDVVMNPAPFVSWLVFVGIVVEGA